MAFNNIQGVLQHKLIVKCFDTKSSLYSFTYILYV
jgi:hypothetical protein